jgi:RNA polymerase sigma factor (sigma-70 family)
MQLPRVDPFEHYEPRWSRRLSIVAKQLSETRDPTLREAELELAWKYLAAALHHYLGLHAARIGPVDPESRRDISSEKALDLLRNLDAGTWSPWTDSPGRVAAFVSTVARNGLVDYLRESGPLVRDSIDEVDPVVRGATPEGYAAHRSVSQEFVRAFEACARALTTRDRTVWFFRVFYEMPSRQIAVHPEVGLSVQNVDVILLRCRRKIRACMHAKGHADPDLPPGTFEELWNAFRMKVDESQERS